MDQLRRFQRALARQPQVHLGLEKTSGSVRFVMLTKHVCCSLCGPLPGDSLATLPLPTRVSRVQLIPPPPCCTVTNPRHSQQRPSPTQTTTSTNPPSSRQTPYLLPQLNGLVDRRLVHTYPHGSPLMLQHFPLKFLSISYAIYTRREISTMLCSLVGHGASVPSSSCGIARALPSYRHWGK